MTEPEFFQTWEVSETSQVFWDGSAAEARYLVKWGYDCICKSEICHRVVQVFDFQHGSLFERNISLSTTSVLAAIHQRLDQPWCRLVTIVGRREGGKARLAAEAARQREGRYADGVHRIALTGFPASAAEPAQEIAARIAAGLGLALPSTGKPLAGLLARLKEERMLLVLLDFPQAMAGVDAVLAILQCCAGVQLLVTSEQALHLRAEWLIPWDGN